MHPCSSSSRRLAFCGLLLLLSTFFVAGCGSGPSTSFNSTAPTLSVSPQITSLPVNGTQLFTATTNAASSTVTWVLVNPGQGTINAGSLAVQGSPTTVLYTAPPTPPLSTLETPGIVTVRADSGLAVSNQTFTITAPSISVGFQTTTTTVALGSTLAVGAYAVGSLNNTIALQVNGVTGGSTSAGTIAAYGGIYGQYIYTAPTSMPMTGSTVTLTVISQADPTKTANLIVTLQ